MNQAGGQIFAEPTSGSQTAGQKRKMSQSGRFISVAVRVSGGRWRCPMSSNAGVRVAAVCRQKQSAFRELHTIMEIAVEFGQSYSA